MNTKSSYRMPTNQKRDLAERFIHLKSVNFLRIEALVQSWMRGFVIQKVNLSDFLKWAIL